MLKKHLRLWESMTIGELWNIALAVREKVQGRMELREQVKESVRQFRKSEGDFK